MASQHAGAAVCPGDLLGSADALHPGLGAFLDGGSILAARSGRVFVEAASPATEGRSTVGVRHAKDAALLPAVGDVVTARVVRVTPRMAVLDILCVGAQRLAAPLSGVLRAADVRETEVASVVIPDCFRPGDLVRAEVTALGTGRDYVLSTARNSLGVVWARSQAGAAMAAASWTEMRCPQSGALERRKVAHVSAPAPAQ